MNDDKIRVYKYNDERSGFHVPRFNGPPDLYVPLADVERMMERVWIEGYKSRVEHYHEYGSNYKRVYAGSDAIKRFKMSKAAAALRALREGRE